MTAKRDTRALLSVPENPKVGDLIYGDVLGKGHRGIHIYFPCDNCHKPRWTPFNKTLNTTRKKLCPLCAKIRGPENHNWKGGRLHVRGYIMVRLQDKDNFFLPMTHNHNRYVFEHRLVMAKHLNRCLLQWEVVHHKNGNKSDNRLENLELLPSSKQHLSDLVTKSTLVMQKRKIEQLEQQLKDRPEDDEESMDDYINYRPYKQNKMPEKELRELLEFVMFD